MSMNRAIVIPAVLVLMLVPPARAAWITDVDRVVGPGLGSFSEGFPIAFATGAEGNDNANFSANFWSYDLEFVNPGPIDIVFNVDATDPGTTEYDLMATIRNKRNEGTSGPASWPGFILLLGFEAFDGGVDEFALNPIEDGLDFDTPDKDPPPFSTRYPLVGHSDDRIIWTGGSMPAPDVGIFSFSLDVPDDALIPGASGDFYQFTLRHMPIPQPTALAMALTVFGFGGATLGGRNRRRRTSA